MSIWALLDKLTAHDADGLSIHVIVDNARDQKNTFVQAHTEHLGITLVYLPAYSPNLNLMKRLWKFVKKKVWHSIYSADFHAFTAAIDQCLTDTQDRYKEELSALLTLNFQTFKNAKIKP